MSNQLQTIQQAAPAQMQPVASLPAGLDMQQLGRILAASGYFKDTRSEAQAIVKVLYGQEIGVGPVSSMMGVHIIEGKPSPSANLVATMVKRSGRYNYRVTRWDRQGCELMFTELGRDIGPASFTEEDAHAAELFSRKVWRQYPKAMYFARAIMMGARTYCPDVFGGAPVYTPEELGVEVDGEGNPTNLQDVSVAPADPVAVAPLSAPSAIGPQCHCGVTAKFLKGKDGKPGGYVCHYFGSVEECDFRMREGGQPTEVAVSNPVTPVRSESASTPQAAPVAQHSPIAHSDAFDDSTTVPTTPAASGLVYPVPPNAPQRICVCGASITDVDNGQGGTVIVNLDGTPHQPTCTAGQQRATSSDTPLSIILNAAHHYKWAYDETKGVDISALRTLARDAGLGSAFNRENLQQMLNLFHQKFNTTPDQAVPTQQQAA